MATLVDNVWHDGRYYGPDHGGDGEVPAALWAKLSGHPSMVGSTTPESPPEPSPSDRWPDAPTYAEHVAMDDTAAPAATVTVLPDMTAMSRAELVDEARSRGLTGATRWSKQRLIDELGGVP